MTKEQEKLVDLFINEFISKLALFNFRNPDNMLSVDEIIEFLQNARNNGNNHNSLDFTKFNSRDNCISIVR